jgi:transcriptional antiterminator
LAFDNYKQSFIFPYSGRICWEFSAKSQKQTPCNQFKNKQLRTLCQLVQLLQTANTGSAKQLATTLQISERTLFNYLDLLKNVFLCPIRFDQKRNSYVFENEGTINFLWENTDCNLIAQT